ncbi:hypothetical protein ElyMa_001273500 [Elysia marginata]|uniref:Uncharacterized protein n=1 Tax=Elysia marginata TaxID=1093978 RepID=A0AAV4IF23_9GAST|nr:hypothetical protein ElyMa_001273500 [Elysia marginata]
MLLMNTTEPVLERHCLSPCLLSGHMEFHHSCRKTHLLMHRSRKSTGMNHRLVITMMQVNVVRKSETLALKRQISLTSSCRVINPSNKATGLGLKNPWNSLVDN